MKKHGSDLGVKLWWLVAVLLLILEYCVALDKPDLCNLPSCHDPTPYDVDHVVRFCEEHNYTLIHRCCIETANNSSNIVGLDLRNCNISSVEVLQQNWTSSYGVYNKKHLTVLQLEENTFINTNTCTCNDGFVDIVNLEYLSLPYLSSCPGRDLAWNHTLHTENLTQCWQTINFCLFKEEDCPPNSECIMHKPGRDWCACLDDYHGYKCLRKGDFPLVPYGVAILVSTVALAAGGHVFVRKKVQPQ